MRRNFSSCQGAMLLLDKSIFISCDGLLFFCCLSMWPATSKSTFQMMGWEILIFHTKLKIKSYLFDCKCREVYASYNIESKIKTLIFLMLCQNSNIILQFIFSNSIPHNDTRIKASKVSNFNEAPKWLVIVFCFENPFSQIFVQTKGYVLFMIVITFISNLLDWFEIGNRNLPL